MKIIAVDNYDRENVSDILVAENVSVHFGESITKYLNARFSGDYATTFFKLVYDDYKLYEFKP